MSQVSKAAKKKAKEEHERLIREAEAARRHGDEAAPQTATDFDRLTTASPNSSFVWIKYMVSVKPMMTLMDTPVCIVSVERGVYDDVCLLSCFIFKDCP